MGRYCSGKLMLADPKTDVRELPSDVQRVIPLPVRRMVLGKRSNARWSLIDLLTLSEEALPALEIPSGGDVPLIAPIRKRHAPKSLDRTRLKLHGNLKGGGISGWKVAGCGE
jgi:hypothetical protein